MSTKTSQPVLGFNHNLKFGPRIYHVQTEDSGLPHAHYITHLFVGGNILASTKTSYAEKAGEPDLPKVVRGLMEGQHKAMVKRLVAGEFNDKVQLFAPHYEPGVLASGESGPTAVNAAQSLPPEKATPTLVAAKPVPAAPARPPAPTPVRVQPVPAVKPAPPAARPPPPPVTRPAPLPPRAPAPVPAAAKAPPPSPPRLPGGPLPPTTRVPPPQRGSPAPPMVLPVAAKPAARAPLPTEPSMAPVMPAARSHTPPPVAPSPLSRNPFGAEVNPYAYEHPVEVPADDIPTLFAEELISEKSLDEVILAFLSADLEQSK